MSKPFSEGLCLSMCVKFTLTMVKIIIIQLRGWGGGSIDETRVVEYLIVEVVGKVGSVYCSVYLSLKFPPAKKTV